MTTAFVLSGGGSLGAVQVGMLQALDEAGIAPDLIVGTSVGALNAAYVARRPWPGATDGLAAIWQHVSRPALFPFSASLALRAVRGSSNHALSNAGLAALVRRYLPYDRIEAASVRLAVVTTDLLTGREVVLTHGPVADAVLASAALPGIFPPVAVDGHLLFDGGLVDHTPLTVAARLGADRIFVLPTGYACALSAPPGSVGGMALHALSLALHQRLASDVAAFHEAIELRVLPPLCPLAVSPADFTHTSELIRRGHTATTAWLDKPPPRAAGAHLALHEHTARSTSTPPTHPVNRAERSHDPAARLP
jgi:NTE family protein